MSARALLFASILGGCAPPSPTAEGVKASPVTAALPKLTLDQLAEDGVASVIVGLSTRVPAPEDPVGEPPRSARIVEAERRFLDTLGSLPIYDVHLYRHVAAIALSGDEATLTAIASRADVTFVREDGRVFVDLRESVPQVGGTALERAHPDALGAGATIAVIDTGVDRAHPFLGGRVVEELCLSSADRALTFCPNGLGEMRGAGAAAPCAGPECRHGTHVAGIAAGRDGDLRGMAPEAGLIAIQVFERPPRCRTNCAWARDANVLAALDEVVELADQRRVAAVNLSLGVLRPDRCAGDPLTEAVVTELRRRGVLVVAAAGNGADGTRTFLERLEWPACVRGVVSVGAVDDLDRVAPFSMASRQLSLLAPGVDVKSSVPGGGYDVLTGTSQAGPHVAGAAAVLAARYPRASVGGLVTALESTGASIVDARFSPPVTFPRLQVDRAFVAAGLSTPEPPRTEVGLVQETRPGAIELDFEDDSHGEDRFEGRCEDASGAALATGTAPANDRDDPRVHLRLLTPESGVRFDCEVRACLGSSCSAWVSAGAHQTYSPALPAAPSALRVAAVSRDSISLAWAPGPGPLPAAYSISFTGGSSTGWRQVTTPGDQTSITLGTLEPDETYAFYLASCAPAGCSARLGAVASTLEVGLPPTDLRITARTAPGRVHLAWTNHRPDATHFELDWASPASAGATRQPLSWVTVRVPGLAPSADFVEPIPGISYFYRVRACSTVTNDCTRSSDYAR